MFIEQKENIEKLYGKSLVATAVIFLKSKDEREFFTMMGLWNR